MTLEPPLDVPSYTQHPRHGHKVRRLSIFYLSAFTPYRFQYARLYVLIRLLRLLHTTYARTPKSLHPAHTPAHTPTKQVCFVSAPVLTFLDHFEHALHGLFPRPR